MSGPKITFNSTLETFNSYINMPGANLRGVTIRQVGDKLKFEEGGFPYVPLFRSAQDKINNNRARFIFYNAVCEQFGGKEYVPDSVKKALCLNDYGNIETCGNIENFLKQGSGKPLSYSRIQTVLNTVKKVVKADPKMYADNIIRGLWEARLSDIKGGQEKMKSYLFAQFDKLFPKSAFQDKNCINEIKQNIDRLSQSLVGGMYERPVKNYNDWFGKLVQLFIKAINNLKQDSEKRNFAQGVLDRLQVGVDNFDNYINEVLVSNQGALKRLTPEETKLAEEEDYGRKLSADLKNGDNIHRVFEELKNKGDFNDTEKGNLDGFLMFFYDDLIATMKTTNKEEVFKSKMSGLYEICIKRLGTTKPKDKPEFMSFMKGFFKGYFTPEKIESDWQKLYAKNEAASEIANWKPISEHSHLEEIINKAVPDNFTPKETGEKLFDDIWAVTYSNFSFETKVNDTVTVLNNFINGILGEEAAKESEDAIYKIAMKFSGERGIIATQNTLVDVLDGREMLGELFKSKQLDENGKAKLDGFKDKFKLFVADQQERDAEGEVKSLSLKFDRTPKSAEAIQAFFERLFEQKFDKLLPKDQLKQVMNKADLPKIAQDIAQGGDAFKTAKNSLQQCFNDIVSMVVKNEETRNEWIAWFKQCLANINDSSDADAVGDKAFLDINTLLINEKNMQQDEKKLAVTVKLKDIVTDLFGKKVARDSKEEIAEIANELCEKSQTSNKNIDGFERIFGFFDKQQAALVDDNEKQVVSSKIKGLIKGFEKHIPLADAGDKVVWLVEKYGNTVKKASDLQTFMEWYFKSTFKSFDANELDEYLTQLPTITKDIISNKDDDEKFYEGKAGLEKLFNDCAAKIQNESRRQAEMKVFEYFLSEIRRDNLVD